MFKLKPLAQASLLAFAAAGVAYAAAPGGAVLQHQINATYQDSEGNNYSAQSNIVEISIREVRSATLIPIAGMSQSQSPAAGGAIYSSHMLTNTGNVTETYALTAANVTDGSDSIDGNSLQIYVDDNQNGQLDTGETAITSITLDAGQSVELLIESMQPTGVASGDTMNITLDAADSQGNTATDQNMVQIAFSDTYVSDRTSALPVVWEQSAGGNCNAYVVVNNGSQINWADAKVAAESMIYNGAFGHLATLTSMEENDFVTNLGIDGGTYFGLHQPNGTDWEWVTGETFDYANWGGTEPDNANGTQDYGGFWPPVGVGKWGDFYANSGVSRYVVEFEQSCNTPPNVVITLESAPDTDCDNTIDAEFNTTPIVDMLPGECALLRTRATNNGTDEAVNVEGTYVLPTYAEYMPGSIVQGGVAKTDASDGDGAAFRSLNNDVFIRYSVSLPGGATSEYTQFGIKIEE